MRSAAAALLFASITTISTAQALPPPADAPSLGTGQLPATAQAGRSADTRASQWVWSTPEYCWGYPLSNGTLVTRLVATSGMWIETVDHQVSAAMVGICTSGRNFATFVTTTGGTAFTWNQLVLPAR